MRESRNPIINAMLAMMSSIRATASAAFGHLGNGYDKRDIEALEELLCRRDTFGCFGAKPLVMKEK